MYRPSKLTAALSAAVLALAMLCSGCVTSGPPATGDDEASNFDVALVAPRLAFTSAGEQAQAGQGYTVNLGVRDSLPELYNRYNVRGGVNGTYFMMPAPPQLYRVYRTPYYKLSPPNLSLKFTISNTSGDVLYMNKAVCAFDLDGKTIASVPLQGPDVLPGHTGSFAVDGPAVDQFKQPPQGNLTVWLYGLGGEGHTYHWDMRYQYTEEKSTGKGEYLGKTTNEKVAKSYEGREERASASDSQDNLTPP
jgi:hypothetical protein